MAGDLNRALAERRLRIDRPGVLISYKAPHDGTVYCLSVFSQTECRIVSVYKPTVGLGLLNSQDLPAALESHASRFTDFTSGADFSSSYLHPEVAKIFAQLLGSGSVPILGQHVQSTPDWPEF
jgi:hypothetical protein